MARRVYATAADLAASIYAVTPPPADVDNRLARASGIVEHAVALARYDVDANGLPTDAAVAEAMRQATCAQVAYWAETGDVSGAAAGWSQVGIGSVHLARAGAAGTGPGDRLAPDAYVELDSAGLISPNVTQWRGCSP